MSVSSGSTFAGYRIVRLLGSGGMGEVYLAKHPRLPRQDALKLLPAEWSADDEYRARFTREADLASTLWHPHIVAVHDRGEFDGQLWISMDYVDGTDASQLLAESYPVGMHAHDVVRIVSAVAGALDHAHQRGMVHRDVKPANIMLSRSDDEGEQRVLLTDFGIARDANDISELTQTNMTVGTVAYSAPEQLKGELVDGRADQYALAATAYHLFTGSPLFPRTSPAAVISGHLVATPPSLSGHRADLASFDPILAIALAKEPKNRFARTSDFANALSEQLSDLKSPRSRSSTVRRSQAAQPIEPDDHVPESTVEARRSRVRSNASGNVAMAVIALALVIVVALYFWRPWSTPELDRPPPIAIGATSTTPSTSTSVAPPPLSRTSTPPPAPVALPDTMPTNSGCRGEVVSHTDIEHKYLGTVRLFLSVTDAGGFQQVGCVASVAASGRVLPAVKVTTSSGFFGFPSPATDATGNTFVTYNPGRFDGVMVLVPTTDGFQDVGVDETGYTGRLAYYYAEVKGPDANGEFIIRHWQQNCTPSCAEGVPTYQDLHWNGSDYVA
jgi:serine/threonine protein kinase, bacterial